MCRHLSLSPSLCTPRIMCRQDRLIKLLLWGQGDSCTLQKDSPPTPQQQLNATAPGLPIPH